MWILFLGATIQPTTYFIPEQEISFLGPGEGTGRHGYTHTVLLVRFHAMAKGPRWSCRDNVTHFGKAQMDPIAQGLLRLRETEGSIKCGGVSANLP